MRPSAPAPAVDDATATPLVPRTHVPALDKVKTLLGAPAPPPVAPEPTPAPPPVEPAPAPPVAAPAPPPNASPHARLQGMSATATPTTPAIPQRTSRVTEPGVDEVTHVFHDPRRPNAPGAAARTPLPLRRPFASAPGTQAHAAHAIHDSSPMPHRALRVCVLRATSPGTFLVRPLAPGEPLPPNGREAFLLPINPDDDFSH